MIRAIDVRVQIGDRTLLRDSSFSFSPGECIAILGANGVGKTSLLRTLAGVRRADGGKITVDGRDIHSLSPAQRARSIAHVVTDELFLDRLGVRDVVSMGRYAHHRWYQWNEERTDVAAVAAALQAVDMSSFAQRRFDTLSSGERQRVWLALAIAQEAPVLLLDEPTSHLDVRVARDILHVLRELAAAGKTVISVLHDINEAADFADRIMLIGCGRVLAFDTPQQVLTPSILRQAYDIDMERVALSGGAVRVFPYGVTTVRSLPADRERECRTS